MPMNLPNKLTIVRIIMIPFFVILVTLSRSKLWTIISFSFEKYFSNFLR